MCASETLKRSCEKKKTSPARTERAQRVAVRLHTHTHKKNAASKIKRFRWREREKKRAASDVYASKMYICRLSSRGTKNSATFLHERERERVNVEAHTYRSASRRWGLVTCVIAVRALSHSQPRRLKPCVSVHFCFVFF